MNFLHEFSYTIRLLRKKAGFSALCICVIALGFAIAIPLYSVVKNFAYPILPIPDGDRLVIVSQTDTQSGYELTTNSFDFYQLDAIRQNTNSFESLGPLYSLGAVFSDGDTPESYGGDILTAEVMNLAGTPPILGRSLQVADEQIGADAVVLIGYEIWQNYYAGDPDIVGKISQVNALPHTIVGVMPEGFEHPQSSQFWLPLNENTSLEPGEGSKVGLFGKLHLGVSRAEAGIEVATIVESLSLEFPNSYPFRSAIVVPYWQGWFGDNDQFDVVAVLVFGIFTLVCLNIGILLLIRANERLGELAIRSAVGASRNKLVFHILLESFLICFSGALLGILLGGSLLAILQVYFSTVFVGGNVPYWFDYGFTPDVVLLSFSMLLGLWLLSGVFAAWRTTKNDISITLGTDAKGRGTTTSNRITASLVLIQISISFFLLVSGGAYLYNYMAGYKSEVVANEDQYLTAQVTLRGEQYDTEIGKNRYREQLTALVRQIPGIESVSVGGHRPGNRGGLVNISIEDVELSSNQRAIFGESFIDENYFETLKLPLLEGRAFDSSDDFESSPVALADQAFIQRAGFSGSPVGQIIQIQRGSSETLDPIRIVGVVPEIDAGTVVSNIYRPVAQKPSERLQMIVALGANSPSVSDLTEQIKQVAATIDREIPITSFNLMSDLTKVKNSVYNLFIGMFGSPILVSLILAIIGIFGLIARSVFERINEIGIRRALGSSNMSIMKIFIGRGVVFLIVGVLTGGGAATLLLDTFSSGSVQSLLSLLAPVFGGVALIVAVLVCLASYLPVRKAIALEPGEALHYE